MRRANLSPIRLAAALPLLLVPSCFSLPKVDVVRVIDDFAEDAGLARWSCGPYVDPDQAGDAGQDGGLGGDIDAGPPVTCTLGLGAGNDMDPPPFPSAVTHALVASFNLTTPHDLTTPYDVEVVTQTATPPGEINLTGFSQLLFSAKLLSTTPGTAPLPTGTELHLALHCSSSTKPLVDQNVTLTPGVVTWKPISLPLGDFTGGSQRQTCLAAVESIGFIVVPGSAEPGIEIAGTLQLDDIRLR